MAGPPKQDVVRVREFKGRRGGTIIVLMLACGHWKTARRPATQSSCIACYLEQQMKDP